MFDREAEGLVDHVQHVADVFAMAAGHGGGVFVRNLEPLVVRVRDLKRDNRVAVVFVFWRFCLCCQ